MLSNCHSFQQDEESFLVTGTMESFSHQTTLLLTWYQYKSFSVDPHL